jgi:hypothetical protein
MCKFQTRAAWPNSSRSGSAREQEDKKSAQVVRELGVAEEMAQSR